jgi:mono/diheme cytochrome c family protein
MGVAKNEFSRKTVEKLPASSALIFAAGLLLMAERSYAQANHEAATAGSSACVGDNGGITLSAGFCATAFADKLGHARHMVVAPNGVVYVNTWSGRYYHNDTPPPGGFLIALQDTKGDGRADKIVRFGRSTAEGNAGGTGVAIYKGYLYAETNDRIGASTDQVALGERIFEGQVDGGTCAGCHGGDGKGTGMGSDLTSGKWLWGNGSLQAITRTIAHGVPNPSSTPA